MSSESVAVHFTSEVGSIIRNTSFISDTTNKLNGMSGSFSVIDGVPTITLPVNSYTDIISSNPSESTRYNTLHEAGHAYHASKQPELFGQNKLPLIQEYNSRMGKELVAYFFSSNYMPEESLRKTNLSENERMFIALMAQSKDRGVIASIKVLSEACGGNISEIMPLIMSGIPSMISKFIVFYTPHGQEEKILTRLTTFDWIKSSDSQIDQFIKDIFIENAPNGVHDHFSIIQKTISTTRDVIDKIS